jgi:hypothetical protein
LGFDELRALILVCEVQIYLDKRKLVRYLFRSVCNSFFSSVSVQLSTS